MNSGIFLLLGTNLGVRLKNLQNARQQIMHHIGPILDQSSIFQTAPWGVSAQPDYLNQVIQIETPLLPNALLKASEEIELEMGRARKDKWDARIIDIDILFYNDEIIDSDNLTLPHPRLQDRNFTLVPLAELAPKFIHPISKKNMLTLLNESTDSLPVTKYTEE